MLIAKYELPILPHKRVKSPASDKAEPFVQIHCFDIGFGHGERERAEVPRAEFLGTESDQRLANVAAAVFRKNTKLSDVAHVVANPRAQEQPGDRPGRPVQRDERRVGIEYS